MTPQRLKRQLGLFGTVVLGLGSILGSGVFVSIGIGAGIAGPAVLLAIVLAGSLAACNGLNSAQLAASYPVSGGTYEYGYQLLNPVLGFMAGWMFLCAKSASAATAALGLSGYLLGMIQVESHLGQVPLAAILVGAVTLLVLCGIRRTTQVNVLLVSVVLFALFLFVLGGWFLLQYNGWRYFSPFFRSPNEAVEERTVALLHTTALMFVAYTGYARIATLGEEVSRPRWTIPRAMIITLSVSMTLYVVIAFAAIGTVGSDVLAWATNDSMAPLQEAAGRFGFDPVAKIVSVGALAALAGVLINLILGLSRMMLAMARRGDMPEACARINRSGATPYVSVIAVGLVIMALTLVGSVRVTWTFSAFTVLVYYAITNLAAIRLPDHARLYPTWLAWVGLAGCLFLAFWVEPLYWLIGLAMMLAGLLWYWGMNREKAGL